MSLLWVFALVVLQRLFELVLSSRNGRMLCARGGQEFFPETFPIIVILHMSFLVSLVMESFPWRIPFNTLTVICLALLIPLQFIRYWCMVSLGPYWNTRIILIPQGKVKRQGPYLILRHPNYLVVNLEFILLPLLMRAPVTLVLFFIANQFILGLRIKLEESALAKFTDYKEIFDC